MTIKVTPAQIQTVLGLLKQPSTYKGILGLTALFGVTVQPEGWKVMVEGLGVIYMLIAIFWQQS